MAASRHAFLCDEVPLLAGLSLWPPLEGEGTGVARRRLRKFSLRVDSERNIDETSIIIEYLQLAHPGPVRLVARRFGPSPDVRVIRRRLPTPTSTPVRRCASNPEISRRSTSEEHRI